MKTRAFDKMRRHGGPPETDSARPQIRCSSIFWAEWPLFCNARAPARTCPEIPNAELFRIGANVGDVIHERDRLYGDGINVAATAECCASG